MDDSLRLHDVRPGAPGGWPVPRAQARPRPPRQAAMEHVAGVLFRWLEVAVAVAGLFLFAGALSDVFRQGGASTTASGENFVLRAIYSTVYLLMLPSLLVRWRSVLAALARHRWTLLLVGVALLSVRWSADPDWTLRRSFALLLTTLFGVFVAARFDPRSMLKLLGVALGVAGALSVVFAIALPAYGVEQEVHTGAWRGVFSQKNNLGQMMVLGAMVFLLLRPLLERRWVAWAGAALSVGLVLLSTSKTALAVLLTLGVLVAIFRALRWRYMVAVPYLVAAVLLAGSVALWLVANLEEVLVSLGKDPSLTGRMPMWEAVAGAIAQRPWLGYGYSAFWLDTRDSPSAGILRLLQWETPHAHNGFLDLALQLGLVGLGIFVVGLALALARSIAALRTTRSAEGLWPVLFLSYLVLYNVTETSLMVQHNLMWVLYVATVCSPLLSRGGGGEEAPPPEEPVRVEVGPPPVQGPRVAARLPR